MARDRRRFDPRRMGYPRLVLVGFALAVAVALAVAATTSAAAFGVYNPAWDGASDLRAAAEDAGAGSRVVLNASGYGAVPTDGTVAVVLSPDRAYSSAEAARIRRFVRRGGTLVVAEDFGPHSNALLDSVGADARFDGALLRDERFNYRSPAMPVATNVSRGPYLTGVDQLTLNYGTVLDPGGATVAARSSEFGYLDRNRNGRLDENETLGTYPVVTVESVGDGRVVAVSDPSLFINAMLDRPGNGEFVAALFGAHGRVLLDYSHAERPPPLALALLSVRGSSLLQAVLGLGGLAAIAAWGRGSFGRAPAAARRLLGRTRPRTDGPATDVESLVAYLTDRNPDWEAQRARRVAKEVLHRRDEPGEDE